MRRLLFLIVLCLLLSGTVSASESLRDQAIDFGADVLEENLPRSTEKMLDDLSPFDAFSFTEKLKDLLEDLRDRADSLWKPVLKTMIRILCILVLCGLAECFDQEGLKRIVLVAGSLAIVVTCTADMKSLIGLGLSTMDEISSFSSLLLPVMTSAAAASGAQSGAAALYAVSVLFFRIVYSNA